MNQPRVIAEEGQLQGISHSSTLIPQNRFNRITEKVYSADRSIYEQRTVILRIEAFFLNNIGLIVTRGQIIAAATDPVTGVEPENWHQRLSELRTDMGYTILTRRDNRNLGQQEYVMPDATRRPVASKRLSPTKECWESVLIRADNCCEWQEDGRPCGLFDGGVDAVGGGTVRLTPDHATPHSIDPDIDRGDYTKWRALCGRHQIMKRNYWDSDTGRLNVIGILQAASQKQKREALDFLQAYFDTQRS